MTRLIDAQDTFNVLSDYYHHNLATQHLALQEALNKVPTVDAVPVRHGKWIGTEDKDEQYGYVYNCSVCGTSTIGDSERFCGWCGARMDEERKEE